MPADGDSAGQARSAGRPGSAGAGFDPEWLARVMLPRLYSLDGRVAVVTGAAGGIGRWLSLGLGTAGASILATDIDPGPVERVCDALRRRGIVAHGVAVDLAEDDAPGQIVRAAADRFGRLDILVNNAGVNRRVPILEVTSELLDHIWKVDYSACYWLSREAARIMIALGGGAILHIGSVNRDVGLEDVSLIGPTKAALGQLARVQAVEWARFGIRANVLAPGFMATPMNATHWTDPTRGPWIMDRTPMCRPGHPAELVGAALLLVSDAGSYITGQTVCVDGGFTAGSRWNVAPLAGYGVFLERRDTTG